MANQHRERSKVDETSPHHQSQACDRQYSDLSPTRSCFDDHHCPPYDLEDGVLQGGKGGQPTNWTGKKLGWWGRMTVRNWRKESLESMSSGRGSVAAYKDEDGLPLLSTTTTATATEGYASSPADKPPKRRISWCNYCIFGGISGLAILTVLLAVNLVLTLTTLLWDPEFDDTLRNWGAPGTGTDGLAWYPTDFTRDIQPIACHSHNDYWRRVPLFSALRNGCTSVEADVWLFDDAAPELYVGHNRASLTRNRTFASLYIDPLVKILEGQNAGTDFSSNNNDNGTRRNGVFDVDPAQTLTLLIDVKTAGPETWPAVLAQLQPLRDRGWLSFVSDGELHTRPVTVVGTGNTPFDLLTRNSTYRDAFFDAPLDIMWETPLPPSPSPPSPPHDNPPCAATPPSHPSSSPQDQGHTGTTPSSSFTPLNSYYASAPFSRAVGRTWRGRLTPKQIATIRGQVRGAHRRGLKVRYWDTPSWPMGLRNHVWDVLVREGVDVLNVDDLRGVSRGVW
ncbi:uncharacterized protein L3040_004024 [Drepanopeziza brunnea f. sp. 'multigermtubi']|uniref:uncharacterized protein n=1 Tax=Drepanopeziza brunnea f. sp. 'multigermtubi' TaxID=698441 RepID=UPI0023A028DA|nr:hypothetical protein L3040_004024 [Drepanopeziza brunnea f. sp. 'multigermtubi']